MHQPTCQSHVHVLSLLSLQDEIIEWEEGGGGYMYTLECTGIIIARFNSLFKPAPMESIMV